MGSEFSSLDYVSLACAAAAALILVAYLVRRPALTRRVKTWLFVGLGPLPITAAMVGNVSNFEVTKDRAFCGSCHVMTPYNDDASDPKSGSLASIHSQNPYFGHESCYICHADYGMFGTVVTKLGGMRHVWKYYTEDWNAPSHAPPKILEPFKSSTCMQCHPQNRAHLPLEHQVHGQAIQRGEVTCTAAGCHGRPHPDAALLHTKVKP
jgi:cytochrome c-type protein NapC